MAASIQSDFSSGGFIKAFFVAIALVLGARFAWAQAAPGNWTFLGVFPTDKDGIKAYMYIDANNVMRETNVGATVYVVAYYRPAEQNGSETETEEKAEYFIDCARKEFTIIRIWEYNYNRLFATSRQAVPYEPDATAPIHPGTFGQTLLDWMRAQHYCPGS